jgi:hypothetical protein
MTETTLAKMPRWAPDSRFVLETSETFLEETLAPLADNLSRHVEPFRDPAIFKPLGGIKNDFRSNDVTIR